MSREERENQIDFIQKVKEFMYFSPKHFGVQESRPKVDFEKEQSIEERVIEPIIHEDEPITHEDHEISDERDVKSVHDIGDIHEIDDVHEIYGVGKIPSGKVFSFEDLVEHAKKEKEIVEETEKKIDINKFEELMRRVERLEKELEITNKTVKSDGVRKARVKNQILSLLKQHKKLSSYELSKLIGLSRTRCNEYFRELTKEGLTEGIIIDRKKFYRLMKR